MTALRFLSVGVVTVLVALVRVYQLAISPLLGPRCRFHPTCSHYAVEALRTHGPVRGSGLAAFRILRCQPFSRGGFDPVPPRLGARTEEPR